MNALGNEFDALFGDKGLTASNDLAKLDIKRRHMIYVLAKEILLSSDPPHMLCDVLIKAAESRDLKPDKWSCILLTAKYMPEFASFKPKVNYIDPKIGEETDSWFDPDNLMSRVEILDKCIEITKDN